jgi:hypothetical protein
MESPEHVVLLEPINEDVEQRRILLRGHDGWPPTVRARTSAFWASACELFKRAAMESCTRPRHRSSWAKS